MAVVSASDRHPTARGEDPHRGSVDWNEPDDKNCRGEWVPVALIKSIVDRDWFGKAPITADGQERVN